MKRETMQLYDRIYEKMMNKVHNKLVEKGVSMECYTDCIAAALEHPKLVSDLFNLDVEWYASFNILEEEFFCEADYSYMVTSAVKISGRDYARLIAKSFDLVKEDDMLCGVLGVDDYVDIIEQANMLFFEGMVDNEDIDQSESAQFLSELGDIFGM